MNQGNGILILPCVVFTCIVLWQILFKRFNVNILVSSFETAFILFMISLTIPEKNDNIFENTYHFVGGLRFKVYAPEFFGGLFIFCVVLFVFYTLNAPLLDQD